MPETADEQREPGDERHEQGDEQHEGESEREHELRREATKFRHELRAAQRANDELRKELERRRVESESEQERAIREAVEAERDRLTVEFAGERLHNRLRLRAAGKLREPDDAVLHLGGTLDPNADNAAIDEAIDELIKQRDYLAAPANGERAGGGLVTQGARSPAPGSGGAQSPDDWIRARARGR